MFIRARILQPSLPCVPAVLRLCQVGNQGLLSWPRTVFHYFASEAMFSLRALAAQKTNLQIGLSTVIRSVAACSLVHVQCRRHGRPKPAVQRRTRRCNAASSYQSFMLYAAFSAAQGPHCRTKRKCVAQAPKAARNIGCAIGCFMRAAIGPLFALV